jgi:metal-sulfur cluster biosynthetic enzyme
MLIIQVLSGYIKLVVVDLGLIYGYSVQVERGNYT